MSYPVQSVLALNYQSVMLTWDPVADFDLAGYYVYMSIDKPDDWKLITPMPIKESKYRGQNLRRDRLYFFRVAAVDKTGNVSTTTPAVEVRHEEYKENLNLIPVERPAHTLLKAGQKMEKPRIFSDFTTLFGWDDPFLTMRIDIKIRYNSKETITLTGRNFITQFTLGGQS